MWAQNNDLIIIIMSCLNVLQNYYYYYTYCYTSHYTYTNWNQIFQSHVIKNKTYKLIMTHVKMYITIGIMQIECTWNKIMSFVICSAVWVLLSDILSFHAWQKMRHFGSKYSNSAPVWGNGASMSSPELSPVTQPIIHTPHTGRINTDNNTVCARLRTCIWSGEQIVTYV